MPDPGRSLTLGRYQLGERLATGGMGEVYLGLQQGPGAFVKPVAIKVLLPHLAEDPKAVEAFLREAQLSAQMNHPNIVAVYDVGNAEQYYFIAMELVRGVALSRLIRELAARGQPLEPGLVSYIARCLCDALHHAHEALGVDGRPLGVVHRDVTPHNLMLSVNGEVKLTDFGIARARDHGSSTAGVIKGKFDYLSPEQARTEPVDRRADIFGAGVTLYHLCTGRSPFRRESDLESVKAVLSEPLPDLAAARPDLPPELVAAIDRATAKDAADRFPTARAMREALPVPPADAAERLAALVSSLFSPEVSALDLKTERALTRHTAQATATDAGRARPLARWGLAIGVAGLGAAALAVAWLRPAPAVLPELHPHPAVASVDASTPEPLPPSVVDAGAAEAVAEAVADTDAGISPRTDGGRKPRARPGRLTVDARPWATVFIDGREVGITPLAELSVESGAHVVVLKNVGLGKTLTRRVRITADKTTVLKEDLRR